MKVRTVYLMLIIGIFTFVSVTGCSDNTGKVSITNGKYIHIYSEENQAYSDDANQIKENAGQRRTFDRNISDDVKQLFDSYFEEWQFIFDYYWNPSKDSLLKTNEKTYIKEYEISTNSSIYSVKNLDHTANKVKKVYLDFYTPYGTMVLNLYPKKININGTTYYIYDDEFKEIIYNMATYYNMIIKTYYTEE